MDTARNSTFLYQNKSIVIEVETITPSKLSELINFPNIEQEMIYDNKEGHIHEMRDNKFVPQLQSGTIYSIIQKNHQQQHDTSEKFGNQTSKVEHNQKHDQQQNLHQESPDKEGLQEKSLLNSKMPSKNDFSHTIAVEDNKSYGKPGKIFFGIIENGCIAIEKLVVLSVSVPDIKLFDGRSLRISIFDAIQILSKSFNTAQNVVDEANAFLSGIPDNVRQGLVAFSFQQSDNRFLQKLQNTVNSGISVFEAHLNLFESPRLNFTEVLQRAKQDKKEEERQIEAEQKMKFSAQQKLKQNELENNQNIDEIKSMEQIIHTTTMDIEAFQKDIARSRGILHFITSTHPSEEQYRELEKLQRQQNFAEENKRHLHSRNDSLQLQKIELEHRIKNAKTEPSANWKEIFESFQTVISSLIEIEKTWESLVDTIKTIDSELKQLQNISMANPVDNSMLIEAALHLSLTSWTICQCCEIFCNIVRSEVIPSISKVTSNFGLSAQAAKIKLSNEKTKSAPVKDKITEVADKMFVEVFKNLVKVEAETTKDFKQIFNSVV